MFPLGTSPRDWSVFLLLPHFPLDNPSFNPGDSHSKIDLKSIHSLNLGSNHKLSHSDHCDSPWPVPSLHFASSNSLSLKEPESSFLDLSHICWLPHLKILQLLPVAPRMKGNALAQWPPFHSLNMSGYFPPWNPCTHWPLCGTLSWWPTSSYSWGLSLNVTCAEKPFTVTYFLNASLLRSSCHTLFFPS